MPQRERQADALTDAREEAPLPILFFDGECVLCNGFADLILDVDEEGDIRIASLQGETASRLLSEQPEDLEEWSLVLLDEDGVHEQSEAALRVLYRLGGWWSVLGVFRLVPRLLRDPVYRLIARNRYKLFGRRDACRVPTPEEEDRFLP